MKFCPNCAAALTMQLAAQDQQRLTCSESCGFVHWDNPVPVCAAIVETDEGIILAHNVLWPAGMYSVITGYLDQYEHPDDCVKREVKEELGLDTLSIEFVGHELFKQKNQLLIGYHVKARGEIILNEELDDYKIIPKEKLKAWPMATGKLVQAWLDLEKTRGTLESKV